MSFSCTDKETLVAYVYGECDAETRGEVTAHLDACRACADEVAGFGVVREALGQWTPPGRVGGFRLVRDEVGAPPAAKVLRPVRWAHAMLPALVRVAAAILLIAGGAALANLEVRYDKDGFVVRTGWQAATVPAPPQAVTRPQPPPTQPTAAPVPADAGVTRAELASFQQQMHDEVQRQFTALRAAAPAPARSPTIVAAAADDREWLYKALEESERRQQVNVALYFSRLVSDLQAGRGVDMRRIGIDVLPPALPPQQRKPNWFDEISMPIKK